MTLVLIPEVNPHKRTKEIFSKSSQEDNVPESLFNKIAVLKPTNLLKRDPRQF